MEHFASFRLGLVRTTLVSLLILPLESIGTDARRYLVAKGERFTQNTASFPVHRADASYEFDAFVSASSAFSITNALLEMPDGSSQSLSANADGTELGFTETFMDAVALRTAYPDGDYTFTLYGTRDGTRVLTLNLSGNAFPTVPHVRNFNEAQALDAANNFILSWSLFTNGTIADFIELNIADAESGTTIFRTANVGELGALDGTVTNVTIPAGRLSPSRSYGASLLFAKIIGIDTNSYSGALGLSGYFTRTDFTIRTADVAPVLLAYPKLLSTGEFEFQIRGPPNRFYSIQRSTNLLDWTLVHTVTASTGTFGFTNPIASTASHGFYRAALGPGIIETISQTIRTDQGGTITLSNGSSITIPAGFFSNDVVATLSLLTGIPNGTRGAVRSVSPALSLSYRHADSAARRSEVFNLTGLSSNSSDQIEFILKLSNTADPRLEGAMPLSQFLVPDANEIPSEGLFLGLLGTVDTITQTAHIPLTRDEFNDFTVNRGQATINVGLVNAASVPFFLPQELFWNGSGWTEDFSQFDRAKRTLLFVHGMFSCVESAFSPSVNAILERGCYGQAVGFNYNWAQGINTSGQQLARFLNELIGRGLTNIDIEAHSEGVPVSIAAAVQAPGAAISKMVLLGGPILGTPVANQPRTLLSAFWSFGHLLALGCASPYPEQNLALDGPLAEDLSPNSSILQANRDAFMAQRRQTTKVILVAGSKSLLRQPLSSHLFGGIINDGLVPEWSALALPTDHKKTFPIDHIHLVPDRGVQVYVGSELQPVEDDTSTLLGTWTGTWSGSSQPFATDELVDHRAPNSGTWTLRLEQVNLENNVLSGTLTWIGEDVNWTFTIHRDGGPFGYSYYLTDVVSYPFTADRIINIPGSFFYPDWLPSIAKTGCGQYRLGFQYATSNGPAGSDPYYSVAFSALLNSQTGIVIREASEFHTQILNGEWITRTNGTQITTAGSGALSWGRLSGARQYP